MSPRDDDLAKLAGLMGWWFFTAVHDVKPAKFILTQAEERREIHIPAPDAPLPEALAFVGRIAEALGVRIGRVSEDIAWEEWTVAFRVQIGHSEGGAEYEDHEGDADDLAWAACRAAIAAKGGAT